jgi:hypothetical protein
MNAICSAGITLGVDPLGGSGLRFWEQIARRYSIEIDVVNPIIDPTFSFMTVDRDGKIRMDCSSPFAMRRLIKLKDRFDVAVASDPDHDRHGIVTHTTGLLNPNHYLAVAAWYLSLNRGGWPREAAIAKTLVSSSMIDRVARSLQRPIVEMPVGFKWFVEGLLEGRFGFAGEESAGASFLRQDGTVWTTDKDGLLLGLLAAEITAKTGLDPGEHYRRLTKKYGEPVYERIDARASADQKSVLRRLVPETIPELTLAGEPILAKLNTAPGNGELIGGIKIVTENGWFAVRPSGTENIYKLYAESFLGPDHVRRIQEEAQAIIERAFEDAHVDAAMPPSIPVGPMGGGGQASGPPGDPADAGTPLDEGAEAPPDDGELGEPGADERHPLGGRRPVAYRGHRDRPRPRLGPHGVLLGPRRARLRRVRRRARPGPAGAQGACPGAPAARAPRLRRVGRPARRPRGLLRAPSAPRLLPRLRLGRGLARRGGAP